MPTWTLGVSLVGPSSPFNTSVQKTGTGDANVYDEVIASSQTDKVVNFALDVSACTMFLAHSTADITIETNANDATGGNTLTLEAGIPYIWYTDSEDSFLLTEDVTKLYVTNAGDGSATLNIRSLYDATP
jgi:hypothetical protein